MIPQIEIVILSTPKKRPLTQDYMGHHPYKIYQNPEWPVPRYTVPSNARGLSSLVHEPRPFFCFRGHQEALRSVTKDFALILEDDAVPNRPDWFEIALEACELAPRFDVISLHARHICGVKEVFTHKRMEYLTLQPISNDQVQGMCWAVAALAYIIPQSYISKLVDLPYRGIPWDIEIYNHKACITKDSPFDHDRRFGSVIEDRHGHIGIQRGGT